MINLPFNFSAPTGQVQNTYSAPTITNPYLQPSEYKGLQLHTPSGLYYQNGTMYEPFTNTVINKPKTTYNAWGAPNVSKGSETTGRSQDKNNYIQVDGQYFRPFTGNAEGIVNGNLSMVGMLGSQPTYQPQAIPNLFSSLNESLVQPSQSNDMYGAGRFLGLLGSPIVTTNTQGK